MSMKGYGTITITDVLDGAQIWTSTTAPTSPNYTFKIANLVGDPDAEIKIGDLIFYSYYRYTVQSISDTTVLTGSRTSIRGETGAQGTSVVSIYNQYYLSTSSTTQLDGSWVESIPDYIDGRYYWSRPVTKLSNNNVVYGTPVLETSITELMAKVTPGVGMKINYSAFNTPNSGKMYIHGYSNESPADIDGCIYWNNVKRTVPKKMINPNAILPYNKYIYIVLRLSSAAATTGTLYMVWYNSGWKYAITPTPSAVGGTWNWAEATDIVLGQFIQPGAGQDVVQAYLYNPPRTASQVKTTNASPYQYSQSAVEWYNSNGGNVVNATTMLAAWADGAFSATTEINGGFIKAHTIQSEHLATNAIMSQNFQGSDNPSSPFSATGTFLDLATGNIYSPNFGIDNTYGKAYLNGEIIATSGRIGNSSAINYWEIGTKVDYNAQQSAALIGKGTAYIQVGDFQLSNGLLDTRSYNQSNQLTYPIYDNVYWDFGVQAPILDTSTTGFVSGVDDNFIYIRKHTNTIPVLKTDWDYVFRIDKTGMIYMNDVSLDDRYALKTDVGSTYLPVSGGTITGNLTVNGTLNAIASQASKLTKTITINGTSWDGSSSTTIGTMGVQYGGTGATTFTSGYALIGNGQNAIQTRAIRNNTTAGALGWTSSSTDNTLITTNTLAYWDGRYQASDNKSNLEYVKHGKLGTIVTLDAEDVITTDGGIIDGSLQVTDLTAGNLIVTGAGRFTNGLYGDLTGTADSSLNVKDSGNGTATTFAYSKTGLSTTSWFAAWNGYELRAISPANTKSAIGLGNVDNTSDANKPISTAVQTALNGKSNTGHNHDDRYYTETEIDTRLTKYNTITRLTTTDYNVNKYYKISINSYNGWMLSFHVSLYHNYKSCELLISGYNYGNNHWYSPSAKIITGGYNSMIISFGYDSNYHLWIAIPADTYSGVSIFNVVNGYQNVSDFENLFTIEVVDSIPETVQTNIEAYRPWYRNETVSNATNATYATSAGKITSREFTIGKTTKSVDWSDNVSFSQSEISDNASGSAAGWMSAAHYTKLEGIAAGAQVNSITGVKGNSESSYRTGNVNITATNIGLGNLTNDKQVKGLSSGTTANNLVVWGSNGYTVADSGIAKGSVATKLTLAGTDYSVASNTITVTQANLQSAVQSTSLVLMTSAERTKLSSIQVSEGGTIDFSGVTASAPLTATVAANKTVNITHNTSGISAGTYRSVTVNTYGHVTAGTNPTTLGGYGITDAKIANGVITLGSNTITPLTASSSLNAANLTGTASISTTGTATKAIQDSDGNAINTTYLKKSGGTLTDADKVYYTAPSGTVIAAEVTSILQSPIPKYLWHDVWAFCRATTPKYYTSTDGVNWTEATLEKRLFAHMEAWGDSTVLNSTIKGSRWVWLNGGFYASNISWLVFGITYENPVSHWDMLLETSSDGGSTWTTLTSVQNLYYLQRPIWIRISGTCQGSLRLTITNNSNSASTATLGLCSIRLLTSRWGDQGKGSEFEYPYIWDGDGNMTMKGTLTGTLIGNASTATKANITSTANAVVKYSDTSGTFSDSNVRIENNDLIIGSMDGSTTVGAGNFKIGVKNDNYGIMPHTNNYNQIGSSSLYWYRAYVTNYYGTTSSINNWVSGKNIGTPSSSSAASTLGTVNFYNNCAAGGTQTKTTLTADSTTASNITLTLPNTTGTIALTSSDITGNAATATSAQKDGSGNVITSTYVAKTGAQTMSGNLTISNTSPSLIINNTGTGTSSLELKRSGSSAADWQFINTSGNFKIQNNYTTSEGSYFDVLILAYNTGNATFKGTVTAPTFIGALTGNATSATKATQDGSGNTITSTYAKLSGATFTGAVTGTSFGASSYMSVNTGNSGTAGGLALYGTTPTTYGIAMRGTGNGGKHGYVQGDWAIYNYMSASANVYNRGWIWRSTVGSTTTNVASISGDGSAVFSGSVTVGGNATNDSGCRMEYNATTKSLDFIFN